MKNLTILNDMLKEEGMQINFTSRKNDEGETLISFIIIDRNDRNRVMIPASAVNDMVKMASGQKECSALKIYLRKGEKYIRIWDVLKKWGHSECSEVKCAEDLLPNRVLALNYLGLECDNRVSANKGSLQVFLDQDSLMYKPSESLKKLKEWSDLGLLDLDAYDMFGN